MYEEFNGTNQSDLARKRGALQCIYKIVKAVRKDEIAGRQTDMFAPPDDG
ncbi:Mor transcription activator family protein [Pseudomonas corrugata]|nr:Mor transcription activator family protein [Pseudomonas corrugata]MDU9036276.1 Mor transcription activator family protein [Pseudomonas corrugata]